jgi:serine/threonine-protein kinase
VIETVPAVGAQVEVGSTVTIVVSSGPEQVAVPDVVGSSLDDARAELERAGLEVGVQRQETDDADPETVLAQDPEGGSEVEEGTTVTLTVAEEVDMVAVPGVTGLDESSAAERLSGAGLEVDVQEEQVDRPSQDGEVLSQSPGEGEEVENGSTVTITVGRFEPDLDPDPGDTGETPPPEEEDDEIDGASGGTPSDGPQGRR